MKTIYLIRHGESNHNNKNNLLSGISDVKLSEKGKQDCKIINRKLKSIGIDQVFTSPLHRAVETTKIIFPDRKFTEVLSLVELNYGDYEGFDQINNQDDEIIKEWDNTPGEMKFPQGDEIKEHAEKVYNGLLDIIHKCDKDSIACISHKSTIRLIIAKILKLNLNNFRRLPCDNCSISILEFSSDSLKVKSINNTLVYSSKN